MCKPSRSPLLVCATFWLSFLFVGAVAAGFFAAQTPAHRGMTLHRTTVGHQGGPFVLKAEDLR